MNYNKIDTITVEELNNIGNKTDKRCFPSMNIGDDELFDDILERKKYYMGRIWENLADPAWIKRAKENIRREAKTKYNFHSEPVVVIHPSDNDFSKIVYSIDCLGIKFHQQRDIQTITNTLAKYWFADRDDFALSKDIIGYIYTTDKPGFAIKGNYDSVSSSHVSYKVNLASIIMMDEEFVGKVREYLEGQGFEMKISLKNIHWSQTQMQIMFKW